MLAALTLMLANGACFCSGDSSDEANESTTTGGAPRSTTPSTPQEATAIAVAATQRAAAQESSVPRNELGTPLPAEAVAATATYAAATAIVAENTAVAIATERAAGDATRTAAPAMKLTARRSGDTTIEISVEGAVERIAAFNLDVVYDQAAFTIEAIAPALDVLEVPGRDFSCNAPPPSPDVDPDPTVGRARLVCFSFGGLAAPAAETPVTIARLTVPSGTATPRLRFENVAIFRPDATGIPIDAPPAKVAR